jgi:hypothetical protein
MTHNQQPLTDMVSVIELAVAPSCHPDKSQHCREHNHDSFSRRRRPQQDNQPLPHLKCDGIVRRLTRLLH